MIRKIIIFILIVACCILQTTVFSLQSVTSVSPNLMIIITISIAFMQGKKEGILTGLISGLLIDFTYGSVYGFYGLLYMLVGYAAGFFCQVYFDNDDGYTYGSVTEDCIDEEETEDEEYDD